MPTRNAARASATPQRGWGEDVSPSVTSSDGDGGEFGFAGRGVGPGRHRAALAPPADLHAQWRRSRGPGGRDQPPRSPVLARPPEGDPHAVRRVLTHTPVPAGVGP